MGGIPWEPEFSRSQMFRLGGHRDILAFSGHGGGKALGEGGEGRVSSAVPWHQPWLIFSINSAVSTVVMSSWSVGEVFFTHMGAEPPVSTGGHLQQLCKGHYSKVLLILNCEVFFIS